MGNWRDGLRGWSGDDLVHPDAPAGGGGPGYFRAPGPTGASFDDNPFAPHPDAPSARLEYHDYAQFDLQERVQCVSEAITKAQSLVGPAIQEETGYALKELLAGILPGLVLTLSILAGSAALGGMVGTALGALAGGVGALPGAAAGAAAGFNVGLFILNLLGIGFLAFYLTKHLSQVTSLLARGVRTAWDAPASPLDTHFMVNAAAADLAHAIAVLIRLILEAIVAYLLTKGAASASSRVPELVAQLRKSKLGEGFAGWVEKNWQGLLGNKKLQGKGAKDGLGSGTTPEVPARPAGEKPKKTIAPAKAPKKLTKTELEEWYRKQGGKFEDPKYTESHVDGTDLSKPVYLKDLPPGTEIIQYVKTGKEPGMYFAYPGTKPEALAIDGVGRELKIFRVTSPLEVVESTAAKYPAGLIPGVGGPGGGQQLILPGGWQASVVQIK